jgi:hypothetical protein
MHSPDKIRTLRKALAAEGLAVVPDPLARFPCPKVVRVGKLPLGEETTDADLQRRLLGSSSLPWQTQREGAPLEPSEHVRGGHRRSVRDR